MPEDPNVTNNLQPPYRMFVTQPPGLVPTEGVPDDGAEPLSTDADLVADVDVRAVQAQQPRGVRLGRLRRDVGRPTARCGSSTCIDEQQQGPGQVANAMRSDTDVADLLAAVQPQRRRRSSTATCSPSRSATS